MKAAMKIIGVLLALTGAVWTLQGANVLGGSFMTGQSQWLVIGLISLVVGLALLAMGSRRNRG